MIIGIVVFAQTFAHLVGYNPAYTDNPILVTKDKFLFLKPGYPFYNPFLIFLNISSKPFDKTINTVLFQSFFPLIVSAGLAVLVFFFVSAIRGYGMNRGDNLYGSARWGTERDLKKFGLTQKTGIVLAEFQKVEHNTLGKTGRQAGQVQSRSVQKMKTTNRQGPIRAGGHSRGQTHLRGIRLPMRQTPFPPIRLIIDFFERDDRFGPLITPAIKAQLLTCQVEIG